jgi:cobalamin-dependent methionine synthase I
LFSEEDQMLIVGERINTSRKAVNEAVEKRDVAYIQADVKAQVEAGADIIDVNAGSRSASELDDLQWLINVIEEAVPARLSLDSSNPDVLAAVVGKVRDLPMLNSTTAEKARFEKMAPVIKTRECDVVALCIGERGVPKTADQVLEDTPRPSCSGGQR